MKKLTYLAIIFFTFIFSFIAPIKINFNTNINNNKIVEKLEPKRAFENAPKKETSLPGLNKSFSVYFNISTINESITFLSNLKEEYNITSDSNIIKTLLIQEITGILNEDEMTTDVNFHYIFYIYGTSSSLITFTIYQVVYFSQNGETIQNAREELLLLRLNNDNSIDVKSNGDLIDNAVDNNIFTSFEYVNEELSIASVDGFSAKSLKSYVNNGQTFTTEEKELNNIYFYGYNLKRNSAVPGLIGTISSIATGLLSLLISLFSSVAAIFWNVSNNTPTFLGVVILFVVAVPITYWVINFVIGLIKKIRLTRGK